LTLGAFCGTPSLLSPDAFAQAFLPDKALRILVGYSAGGAAERLLRVIAPRLEARTGRRVSIENKPSDRNEPAGEYLSKGLVEGSVVAFLPTTTIAATAKVEMFPFDTKSALVPLTMAGVFQVAFTVSPDLPAATFAEYIAWVKTAPVEQRLLGTTATDLYLKLYSLMIGREIGVTLEDRPYKGAAPLVTALKAGDIAAGIGSVPALLDHNRNGAVRMLMTSGSRRLRFLPGVPTAAEAGFPALGLQEWYGFFASSVSPPAVAAAWSRQLQAVLGESEVVALLAQLGFDAQPSTQEEAAARFTSRFASWRERMASFGLKMAE
jgi:tripartite-type tricarboxylate transporter receptor subunit TctC